MAPLLLTFDDLDGSKFKVILFDVKYLKNGNSYHVGPIGFTLDDLERLTIKVTNGAVTLIGMWGYTPVGLTGVLVQLNFTFIKKRKNCFLSHRLGDIGVTYTLHL